MPIFWRYLLIEFLKVFVLIVFSFVGVLLTLRLDEIAHFASLGATLPTIFRFVLYQVPYILPICLPISCLISAILLMKNLSSSHELTALRSSGFSLFQILSPLFFAAIFLTLLNFFIVSEIATFCHRTNNLLKKELRSINPLLLLRNKHLMRLQGIYFDVMGSNHVGEEAEKVLIALPDKKQKRTHLILADSLQNNSGSLLGTNISFLTSLPAKEKEAHDVIYVEDIQEMESSVNHFSPFFTKNIWKIQEDYLPLSCLLFGLKSCKKKMEGLLLKEEKKKNLTEQRKIKGEILRRLSVAFAVFSFTFMGASFGLAIGRVENRFKFSLVILLTTFFLLSYFSAKRWETDPWIPFFCFTLPHFLILLFSARSLQKIHKGIE